MAHEASRQIVSRGHLFALKVRGLGLLGYPLEHATRFKNECWKRDPAQVCTGPKLGYNMPKHCSRKYQHGRVSGCRREVDAPFPWSASMTVSSSPWSPLPSSTDPLLPEGRKGRG